MALVIGLVGEKGSGKETFGDFFEEAAKQSELSVLRIRFSDVLIQTLQLWSLEPSRENLQKLAVVMKDGFGPDTLTHAISELIKNSKADLIVIDGVRWLPDRDLIRKFPENKLVYITATQELRFERLKTRTLTYRKNETQSFEQFIKEEGAENELYIPLIGEQADFKIENNADLEDFETKVKKLYLSLTH